MVNEMMRNDSSPLDYCRELLNRGPDKSIQFIDIQIETKPNNIGGFLLNTRLKQHISRH